MHVMAGNRLVKGNDGGKEGGREGEGGEILGIN